MDDAGAAAIGPRGRVARHERSARDCIRPLTGDDADMNSAARSSRTGCLYGFRLVAIALLFAVGMNAPARAASLKEVLTPEEFRRAGLDKLTPDELAFLSARLLVEPTSPSASAPVARAEIAGQPSSAVAPSPAPAPDVFGREHEIERQTVRQPGVPKRVEARLVGHFGGWSGRTVFKLENGQVWQQAEPGEFVAEADSPTVIVRRGALGAYYLRIDGYGTEVKVKRLK
jgi:hypothetical protein